MARPTIGAEGRTEIIAAKVPLSMLEEVTAICKRRGISRSQLINEVLAVVVKAAKAEREKA